MREREEREREARERRQHETGAKREKESQRVRRMRGGGRNGGVGGRGGGRERREREPVGRRESYKREAVSQARINSTHSSLSVSLPRPSSTLLPRPTPPPCRFSRNSALKDTKGTMDERERENERASEREKVSGGGGVSSASRRRRKKRGWDTRRRAEESDTGETPTSARHEQKEAR